MLESLRDDLRDAVRALWRAKAFSAGAILILASGLAAATAMLALVRGVLWRPLPVRDEARLVVAWRDLPASGYAHHPFERRGIERLARGSRVFEAVAGVDANGGGREILVDGDTAEAVDGALVAGALFDVLGVTPVLGRTLGAADDVEGAPRVVVIGHALWRRRYAASPAVLGRTMTLGQERFTIVGVMPPDLDVPARVQVWRATASVPSDGPFGDAARTEIDLVARLRPGFGLDDAVAELRLLLQQLEAEAPAGSARGFVPVVRPFAETVVGEVRGPLTALSAAVALLLLIACANVANLQLLRAEGRRGEIALHAALGATRGRLVRRHAAESLWLGAAAAAIAIPLAAAAVRLGVATLGDRLPRPEAIRIDTAAMAGALLLATAATAFAGLAPVLLATGRDLIDGLRGVGRGTAASPGIRRGRRTLVVAQVGLAVAAVAAAGLLARTLLQLQLVDTGLPENQLVFAELAIPGGAARPRPLREAVLTRVASHPAVASATAVDAWPYAGSWDVPTFTAEGQDRAVAAANPALNLEAIGPRHFATLRVPVLRGRPFDDGDRAGTLPVAIVSADVAARTWPGRDAVGRRLKFGGPDSRDAWWTVVGVVAETRYRELGRARPTLYLPATQFLDTAQGLAIRTTAPIEVVTEVVRDAVRRTGGGIHVLRVAPLDALTAGPLARPRLQAALASLFGGAAWLLAAVGLYAVLAASVRQRDREIAVRVAVGASPGRIRALVAIEAVALAGVGTGLGVAGAVAGARVLAARVDGLPPLDVLSLLWAAALVAIASALAAVAPVRRATRVDPVSALRA